jgi:hypothetical protein
LDSFPGRGHLGQVSIEGRIILKWIRIKYSVKMLTGITWVRIRPIVGFNEKSDELSGGFVKQETSPATEQLNCARFLITRWSS